MLFIKTTPFPGKWFLRRIFKKKFLYVFLFKNRPPTPFPHFGSTNRQTVRRTPYKKLSEKLTWALKSGELKNDNRFYVYGICILLLKANLLLTHSRDISVFLTFISLMLLGVRIMFTKIFEFQSPILIRMRKEFPYCLSYYRGNKSYSC